MSSLLLPLTVRGASSVGPAEAAPGANGKSLVVFFSRSGNTRVIAGLLSRSLPADLFEIVPAAPYPADYFETVEQARQERDRGYRPPLQAQLTSTAPLQRCFSASPFGARLLRP